MEALSSGCTPPPKDIEQDVDVRRSRRLIGSARKTAKKVYPGSGTKRQVRRSFRTPIQTIPLQGAKKNEKSASRSFAMTPDQDDIFTPRSNIEGFLATAVEQSGPDNTTPDMPKRTVASLSDITVFKIPGQSDGFASRRTQASSDPASTPGSKFTPRTNVFNWIQCLEEPEQSPTVRHDFVNQPSSETRESIIQHQEWGQEINFSPLYLSRTSEGKEDSPSTHKQAFKRPRRSFHFCMSQAMVMASQPAGEQSLAATEESPVLVHASDSDDGGPIARSLEDARESLFEKFGPAGNFGLDVGLSAAESENLGLEVGLSAAESENHGFFVSQHLTRIPSTLDNLNAEVGADLEGRHISVLENLNAEGGADLEGRHLSAIENDNAEALSEKLDFFLQAGLGMHSSVVHENLDAFVNGEGENNNPDVIEDDQHMAADDETIQTDADESVTHETMTVATDLMTDEGNVNNMLIINEGAEGVAEDGNSEEDDRWVVSKSSTCQLDMASEVSPDADAVNETGHAENAASCGFGQDFEKILTSSPGSVSVDVDANTEGISTCCAMVESAGERAEQGFELTEGDAGVKQQGSEMNEGDDGAKQQELEMTEGDDGAKQQRSEMTEGGDCAKQQESEMTEGDAGAKQKELEMTEGDAGVKHAELRKEKSFGSSRTSLTSKHGKIICSSSPKSTSKNTPEASAHCPSVYDLSETSSSSSSIGDVRITKQRSSTPRKLTDSSKSSGKRRIDSAKSSKQNISPGRRSVSRSKSKPSYSEWKAQQEEKGSTSPTMASFLDSRYPLSSTPFDRSKKMFHSTKIHHSVHADEDDVLETQMADSIPNISPIRPVARSQAEKQTSSGREMADVNTDRDDQDVVADDSARIQHGESILVSQDEQMAELDENSSDSAVPGLSPLKTPHVDMNKRAQKPVPGQTSAPKPLPPPQTSGSGQKHGKEEDAAKQPPRKRTKTTSDTALPRRSVKFFAERHSTMKLSKDAVEQIEKASEIFWDNTFKALETFALHAGRKTVKDEDVVLLMKTQGLIKDTEDLHDAIRQFLPMELRSELIPMAKP